MSGPDHKASMEPKKFYEFVNLLKNSQILLGSYEKKPTRIEKILNLLENLFQQKKIF